MVPEGKAGKWMGEGNAGRFNRTGNVLVLTLDSRFIGISFTIIPPKLPFMFHIVF